MRHAAEFELQFRTRLRPWRVLTGAYHSRDKAYLLAQFERLVKDDEPVRVLLLKEVVQLRVIQVS